MKGKIAALVFSALIGFGLSAQDAPKVILNGKVTLNGKKTDGVKVLVFEDNKQITSINLTKNSFSIPVPFNGYYTVRVEKEGHAPYKAFIDTRSSVEISNDRRLPMKIDFSDEPGADQEYYADFPDAIYRFDVNISEFTNSDHYASHITEMKSPLQATNLEE